MADSEESTTEGKSGVVKEWDSDALETLTTDNFFRELIRNMFSADEDRVDCSITISNADNTEAIIDFEIKITNITGK